jgi:hypothetical protein
MLLPRMTTYTTAVTAGTRKSANSQTALAHPFIVESRKSGAQD